MSGLTGTGRPARATARAPRGRPLVAAVVAAVVMLLAAACNQGDGGDGARPAGGAAGTGGAGKAAQRQLLYVAVGASESVGEGADDRLTQAWPQLLFRRALPRETVFVNLGVPGTTVAQALDQQVPEAVRLEPALVTVWLNVNDLFAGVTPEAYERDLARLVRALRRGGRTKVLVANTPPIDRLPAYRACLGEGAGCPLRRLDGFAERFGEPPPPARVNALTAEYNRAIARVAAREGAVLVDLHAAGMAARAAGTEASLISADGFHPSTAGHEAVADAFAAALSASGGI